MTVVRWLGPFALAALVTWRLAGAFAARGPLRRRNYRGLEIPTAAGFAIVLGILVGFALVAMADLFPGATSSSVLGRGYVTVLVPGVLGFALLGLWDDVAPPGQGWRAHLRALRRGEPTGGAIKLAGGVVLALIVTAPLEDGFWWRLLAAAVVAMSANLFNLLDARPGRAGKAFLIAVVPFLVIGEPLAWLLMAGVGAVGAFLPVDLRERAMLGDGGANAIGALVGMAIVLTASHVWILVAAAILAGLHALGERPGLSRVIDGAGPIKRLDMAGRVPDR